MREKDHHNRANKIIRDSKIKRLIVIGVIVDLAIGIGVAVSSSQIMLSRSLASSAPIDNIQCNSMEQAAFHIHMHLDIFIVVATKNYSIDVDPIKDNQNLFNTARVTVTNTGKLPLTNIVVNYGGTGTSAIQKLAFLSPGEKALLSPPESSALQSVTVTADHDVSITKAYRIPWKIPGMMGS